MEADLEKYRALFCNSWSMTALYYSDRLFMNSGTSLPSADYSTHIGLTNHAIIEKF